MSRLSAVDAVVSGDGDDDNRRPSMTATIRSCYHDAQEFPTPVEENMSSSEASREIEELQSQTCTARGGASPPLSPSADGHHRHPVDNANDSDYFRGDSGYESVPSSAESRSRRREPRRRTSTASMTAAGRREKEGGPRRGRPLTRTHKSTASVPSASIATHSTLPHSSLHRKTSSLYRPSSSCHFPHQYQPNAFYYFHAPELPNASTLSTSSSSTSSSSTTSSSSLEFDSPISSYQSHSRRPSKCHGELALALAPSPSPQEEQIITSAPPPPPTTCYWTSNHTRRLEYAAIDAASRGVKGWVRRNLVPDCLVPVGAKKHVAFDDDSGSVRRYRLDLDEREHGLDSERGSDDEARELHEFGGHDGGEDEGIGGVHQAREKPKSKEHKRKTGKGKKKGPWVIFPFAKAR